MSKFLMNPYQPGRSAGLASHLEAFSPSFTNLIQRKKQKLISGLKFQQLTTKPAQCMKFRPLLEPLIFICI